MLKISITMTQLDDGRWRVADKVGRRVDLSSARYCRTLKSAKAEYMRRATNAVRAALDATLAEIKAEAGSGQ